MIDLNEAVKVAEEYLEPTGEDYEAPDYKQRCALRRVVRAVKTLRGGLADIRDNAEDVLELAFKEE